MIRLCRRIGLVVIVATATACFGQGKPVDVDKLVAAIYRAEGGAGATYAYGIRSVRYTDLADAKRICQNSVVNNLKRWHKAGEPGEFIPFMAKRYCPPEPDRMRWIKNVSEFYNKNNQQKGS